MLHPHLYIMQSKVIRICTVLFSKPLDCSTPEGRSQERYRHAAWTTLVMMLARVSNILTGILTVPMTLKYLGEDLFGVWTVLTSVVGFLSFYDFGLGVGLRNMLIECAGKDDLDSPKKLIGNALLVLTILCLLMIVLVFAVLPFLPWGDLIKCNNPASVPQILPTAQSVLLMFALGLPLSQLLNISSAYQRGYYGYLCFLVGRILSFLFVVWCVRAGQPLWLLAGGYVGFPFLVMVFGWLAFLITVPIFRPWPIRPDPALIRRLFGVGFFVLIHTLSYSMINTSAILLIANTINASSSIPYSVTQRLLGVSSVITASIMIGISVAVGEAWHRKEFAWIDKTIRRSEIVVILCGVVPLVLFLFAGQPLILWWTKSSSAVPTFPLLLACVLITGSLSISGIYSNSLIAMNYVRFLAITKFAAGVIVLLAGYIAGIVSQSPTLIAYLQFFIGALIPTLLARWKMKQLLSHTKGDGITSTVPSPIPSNS